MAGLNERSKNDFLVYANSVIKSRAIPSIEDNLTEKSGYTSSLSENGRN